MALRLLREAAGALGLEMQTFCEGWVVRLSHLDGRHRLIWGYNFDLNPSAGVHVARDKAATYAVLRAAGVPAVEHRLFLRPDMEGYVPESGSWAPLLAALDDFGGDAVIKPTDGSGGAGVWRIRNRRELEKYAGRLWERQHAICLAPYVPVHREVRHILLDGAPWIVYEKQIEAIEGDGRRTFGELLAAACAGDPKRWSTLAAGAARLHGEQDWDQVVPAGQRLSLAWKHNLRGARALLQKEPEADLVALSLQAAAVLGLRICAVDVVDVAGARPAVLEVNAGLMLERFAEQSAEADERALALCMEVVRRMFAPA